MDVLRAFRSSRKDAAARDKQETGRPSPELPPEILYLVFKFVTQHTLRTAVRFVCKQWYSVARSMIHVHALWKDRKGGKYTRHFLLARLQQVTHLRVFFEQLSDLNNTRFAWKELEETVDLLRTTNRLHITKLTLNGALFMESRIYTILPKISTLTEIYFERIVQKTVHLGVILSVCRSLRRLYMELPEGYHEIADNTALPWKGTENGLRESGIVSLIIKGMRVEQDSLEAILARCPRLNVLKLIGLFYANSQVHPFNRPKFFETTAASCPHLECVHFSFQEHCLTSVDSLALIQTFFPGIATLSRSVARFLANNDSRFHGYRQQQQRDQSSRPSPSSLSILDSDLHRDLGDLSFKLWAPYRDPYYSETLTTLEILHTGSETYAFVSHSIHHFLCSAPSLIHFTAPQVAYFAEYLDLEGAIDDTGYYYPRQCRFGRPVSRYTRVQKKIWACRRLKTLKLKFTSMDTDYSSAENARIMFGYIAKACPDLEELTIHRPDLDLRLEGGMCLLSKLEKLERLTILTRSQIKLEKRDLEWLAKNPVGTATMRSRVSWLSSQRTTESSTASRSSSSLDYNVSDHSIDRGSAMEYKKALAIDDLIGIESLVEVEVCRRQIAERGCWPRLELLGIQFCLMQKTKVVDIAEHLPPMIAKIRPDVEFSCDSKKW